MALDNAAADAALDVWINGLTPAVTADQKTSIQNGMRPLVRAIYAGIVANAVVSPTSGTPLRAPGGGGNVTGTGSIT